MNDSHWIYLSPHLDDAVYSCGGMLWEQVQRGVQAEVWTIFAEIGRASCRERV